MSKQTKELEETSNEKKELVIKAINAEQELSDIKRDLELRDIKIESLQNIIKKRGFNTETGRSGLDDTQQINQQKLMIARLESDLKVYQNEKVKLVQDNLVLI